MKTLKREVRNSIKEKIKVLTELHVVNSKNEEIVTEKLVKAVKDKPYADPDLIIDRVARRLILNKEDL